jgi:hypothetical protein
MTSQKALDERERRETEKRRRREEYALSERERLFYPGEFEAAASTLEAFATAR